MKNIIFAALAACFFITPLFGETWQEKWGDAVSILETEEWPYPDAKELLKEAIPLAENSKSLPYIYTDLARLHLLLGENKAALANAEKALSHEGLDAAGTERALVTKLLACVRLGAISDAESDLRAFAENTELPFIEKDNSKVIIRNVPNNDYYKKMMTCYLIHCGVCYDLEAFTFLKSGILIAESHCGCPKCLAEYAVTRECEGCLAVISPLQANISIEGLILKAVQYAAHEIVQLDDQVAFLKAVCHMQDIQSSLELFDDTFAKILSGLKKAEVHWD